MKYKRTIMIMLVSFLSSQKKIYSEQLFTRAMLARNILARDILEEDHIPGNLCMFKCEKGIRENVLGEENHYFNKKALKRYLEGFFGYLAKTFKSQDKSFLEIRRDEIYALIDAAKTYDELKDVLEGNLYLDGSNSFNFYYLGGNLLDNKEIKEGINKIKAILNNKDLKLAFKEYDLTKINELKQQIKALIK